MFSPIEAELERGWPGRIDGDTVIQLAAQTLQAFFTGGSSAREHATYPLDAVVLRAAVLEPPAIRIFEGPETFAFANPAAVRSPGTLVHRPEGRLDAHVRIAAVVGSDDEIGGWTGMVEWRAPALEPPKDRDFAFLLGPIVVTQPIDEFDWETARVCAARNTRLRPGDVLAAPAHQVVEDVPEGPFSVELDGLGELRALVP